MAKIRPSDGIVAIHGKIKADSDIAFVTNSRSGQVSTRRIAERDLEMHPVTAREKETNNKMREWVAEYRAIKSDMGAYAQLVEERKNAPIELQSDNVYHYFLKTRMDEGKNSVTLKIAKSKSSEESYVAGMSRCQNRDEADRLLLEFVDKLGYHKLVEAYKTTIK